MKANKSICIFRPRRSPAPDQPFGARSAGHYRLPPGVHEAPAVKHFVQIFWGVAGCGQFHVSGRAQALGPGAVGVYFPGMEHRLAATEYWEYRWWTLDGPLAVAVVEGFGLRAGVIATGRLPDARTHDALMRAVGDVTPAGERQACRLAFELLTEIAVPVREGSPEPLVQEALTRLHEQWREPGFGITGLAAALRVHRSTLSRTFHASVGVSVVEYLTRLRVQAALSLLKQTPLPVSEVATRCGYPNANYFARLIRRRTGLAPLQFRRR